MARPETVRRVKSYSAADGYVYQYSFYEVNRVGEKENAAVEFVYAISSDRVSTFQVRIHVLERSLTSWAAINGRPLTSSEEYAVAKMRLFQGFDEGQVSHKAEPASHTKLVVDEGNLEVLLQRLNI
ncbi:MAG TPA: hypothetical protein VGI13_14250 [Candidatus Acidoferrum sp.]|jgi:hypothetical protein